MSKSTSSSGSFSVLGGDITITGNISAATELHIDGTVEGDIECSSLVQGEGSRIAGEVQAETARLAGQVDGSIHARELVILRSATINGDVHYETLTVEQGAAVQGRFGPRDAAPTANAAPAQAMSSGMPGTANGSTTGDPGVAAFASDNDTDGEPEQTASHY